MSESVIADDLHIKGEITTSGDIELKGTVEGEVTCRTLLIAEEAKITGKIKAEKIVIRGTVEGTINGIRVTLTSSAKVKGELICKALAIDEDAYFDGTSQRVDDPLGLGEVASKPRADSAKKAAGGNGKPEKQAGEKVQPLAAGSTSGAPPSQTPGH
ncbi:MAG: polymer-forming cytoskeletal protein [Proteobacteria bacterium]|nr:polymer-forming cytoskeletal protein [Pseudomonadota bacterium]